MQRERRYTKHELCYQEQPQDVGIPDSTAPRIVGDDAPEPVKAPARGGSWPSRYGVRVKAGVPAGPKG